MAIVVAGHFARRPWIAILAAAALAPGLGGAVCLYPDKDLSGYRIPLDREIDSSPHIAIGKVVSEKQLTGPGGPEWFAATIYSVRVEAVLKGRLHGSITLRIENDSGRYAMDVGERHILFLQPLPPKRGAGYSADSCGNSSLLPEGEPVVQAVQARIMQARRAP
jgi:hypothetical protein